MPRKILSPSHPELSAGLPDRVAAHHHELPLLDVARFVAAMLVMLNHLRVNQFMHFSEVRAPSILFKQVFFCLTRVGLESVLLFFVLSGFLVGGMSLSRAIYGKFDPWKYFIDRFTRIYTPFAPILLLTIGVCIWCNIPFSWSEAAINLLSLQGVLGEPFSGNTSLWSLSYEIWFYISCGGLLALMQRPFGRFTWIYILLLTASVIVFSQLMVAYLCAWLIGLCAYFLRTRHHWVLWLGGLAIAAVGLVLMQLTSTSTEVNLEPFRWLDRSFVIIVFSVGLGLLVAACAQVDPASKGMKRVSGIAGTLAAFSYTLYLVHIPIIVLFTHYGLLVKYDRLGFFTIGAYFANATFILAVSFGVYFLFERQTPRVRKFLYRKLLTPSKHGPALVGST